MGFLCGRSTETRVSDECAQKHDLEGCGEYRNGFEEDHSNQDRRQPYWSSHMLRDSCALDSAYYLQVSRGVVPAGNELDLPTHEVWT